MGGGEIAARLICEDSYSARIAKSGNHGEITIALAFWDQINSERWSFNWKFMKHKATSLNEAKLIAEIFINRNINRIAPQPYKEKENEL